MGLPASLLGVSANNYGLGFVGTAADTCILGGVG